MFEETGPPLTTNLLFKVLMEKLGVTDVPSYFRRLWFWIGACVVLGALFGAHRNGVEGVIWGALAGIVAPGWRTAVARRHSELRGGLHGGVLCRLGRAAVRGALAAPPVKVSSTRNHPFSYAFPPRAPC